MVSLSEFYKIAHTTDDKRKKLSGTPDTLESIGSSVPIFQNIKRNVIAGEIVVSHAVYETDYIVIGRYSNAPNWLLEYINNLGECCYMIDREKNIDFYYPGGMISNYAKVEMRSLIEITNKDIIIHRYNNRYDMDIRRLTVKDGWFAVKRYLSVFSLFNDKFIEMVLFSSNELPIKECLLDEVKFSDMLLPEICNIVTNYVI